MTLIRRILVFISIMLPVAGVAVYSYILIRQAALERVYDERRSLASLSAQVLHEKLDRIKDLGLSFSARAMVRHHINEQNWETVTEGMKQVLVDFPYIERVFITDTAGTLMADAPSAPALHGINYAHRDWYKGFIKNRQPYLSEVYKRAESPHDIVTALAVPIKNNEGKVRGILVLQVNVAHLLGWSREVSIGKSGFIYVVDHKGNIAANPQYTETDSVNNYSSVLAVQKALRGEKGVEIIYNAVEKENRLTAYEQIPEYGWAIIVQQEAGAALSVNSSLQLIVLIYAFAVLMSCAFAFFITREMNFRKKAEEQVMQHAVQLETVNKELESFSYSVSHDLRAPLRAVHGYAQILKEDYSNQLDVEAKRLMNNIMLNAKKMGQLIDDLLTFSRLGRKELVKDTISMKDMVQDVCEEFKDEQEQRNIEFDIKELLPAQADNIAIRQVWLNLISNAIKYSKQKEKAIIEIGSEIKGNEITYHIKDNGAGFDMRYYDKLFGVFQRLHSDAEFEGNGVGLAIVQRIIVKHGGRVWAEGKVGEGATFYFTLNK